MKCRHCEKELQHVFLDLGFAPPSNAYLTSADLQRPETYYPLKLLVCDDCWLVQTDDYADAGDLFNADYAYFSSTSTSWLEHAADYCEMIISRLGLSTESHVIEVASNDGYLLKNFVSAGIPCTGIEPTASTAREAEKLNIPVIQDFFGEALGKSLAKQGKQADLILGNNVFAHVPDINDFAIGLRVALKAGGTITLEFPHLMKLLEFNQFDTVYHEHFSYLSLYSVTRIFERAGLRVYDVEQLITHGGSLRVYGCHQEDVRETVSSVKSLLSEEKRYGMNDLGVYINFQAKADKVKNEMLMFLIEQMRNGKKIAAYGAAAKGCTLLNYAGVKPDLLPFVCDKAASKQGKYLPGSHIPILDPTAIDEEKPDYIWIPPWNIADEVMTQLTHARQWGAQFVTAVPELRIS